VLHPSKYVRLLAPYKGQPAGKVFLAGPAQAKRLIEAKQAVEAEDPRAPAPERTERTEPETIAVELLEPYGDHKAGAVIQVGPAAAERLIATGKAKNPTGGKAGMAVSGGETFATPAKGDGKGKK
jgi:hypothetical protein